MQLLQRQGANTLADTHQLYRRIAFNVLIHNTDDHLRNHGFFVGRDGMRLSPAYDLNPSIDRDELTLTINETESLCDIDIVRSAHGFYDLSLVAADAIIAEVQHAAATWRIEATALRISRVDQAAMADAFEGPKRQDSFIEHRT